MAADGADGINFDIVTTKNGDGGSSALYSGERLPKSDIHFAVLGAVDELDSYLGVARTAGLEARERGWLRDVQVRLYRLMSVVATSPENADLYARLKPLDGDDLAELEERERLCLAEARVKPGFVVPGDSGPLAAHLDYARTLARRAERAYVEFAGRVADTAPNLADLRAGQRYLNRLSDFLFVLARLEAARSEALPPNPEP